MTPHDSGFAQALQLRPTRFDQAEWRLRLELAACYRLVDWHGWSELVFNHITARLPGEPGEERRFLINALGLHYGEITAANLVCINQAGDVLDDSGSEVNRAGFIIHGAIHGARDDAHCILHTHTTAGMAIACKQGGLRNDNFYSIMLDGRIAYHDFEGEVTDPAEGPRLVANLGRRNLLILRNHGLLAIGRTVAQMFLAYWTLERACQIQFAADSMGGAHIELPAAVIAGSPARLRQGSRPVQADGNSAVFAAMLRKAGIRYPDLV